MNHKLNTNKWQLKFIIIISKMTSKITKILEKSAPDKKMTEMTDAFKGLKFN